MNMLSGSRNAQSHEMISVLFADVVGFIKLCSEQSAVTMVVLLDDLFTAFDSKLDEFGIMKGMQLSSRDYVDRPI